MKYMTGKNTGFKFSAEFSLFPEIVLTMSKAL
jgi:hypothetical protein